jgi:hypothetical protein
MSILFSMCRESLVMTDKVMTKMSESVRENGNDGQNDGKNTGKCP